MDKKGENTEINPVTDAEPSESDKRFIKSLYQFIKEEKRYLQCPEEGADERRYIIYRSVFNKKKLKDIKVREVLLKVIGRAAANRRLLLAIKSEYDAFIRELKTREEEGSVFQGRAADITDRTLDLQRRAAELQEEVSRFCRLVPGLTMAQSEDPEVLLVHLKNLQTQRAVLLKRIGRLVPSEVRTELDSELDSEQRRDQLIAQNQQLMTRHRRLRLLWDGVKSWQQTGRTVPLEDLLRSTIQNIQMIDSESQQDEGSEEDSGLLEDEEPSGVDESELLQAHLDRFLELLQGSEFEAAALQASRCAGVLRSCDTMQMFRGLQSPPGSAPPALLFFWALLVTTATGAPLSAGLSLQGVGCALEHGETWLVAHAVTQNKLTLTEQLGDVLTEHAQRNVGVADRCLALATDIYQACGAHQKVALSMCRRGLVHSAAEVMEQHLSTEDCLWVLFRSPSLPLLQRLTESQRGRAAILSVGGACASMLADSHLNHVALQLLDGFVNRGPDVLEDVILEDSSSSVDVWDQVASLCSHLKRDDLSRAVRCVLLDQNGTGVRSPDPEGARLMEHVFL